VINEESTVGGETRFAVFDGTRTYRYRLGRIWDETRPVMTFIGLNPSIADAMVDDPTIRRCRGFAMREDCGGLVMVNLFAYRSTDPARLRRAPDPVGPANANYLLLMVASAGPAVAAWGAGGSLLGRDQEVLELLNGMKQLQCLGTTKDGHPRHPLYLAGTTPLQPFGGVL